MILSKILFFNAILRSLIEGYMLFSINSMLNLYAVRIHSSLNIKAFLGH